MKENEDGFVSVADCVEALTHPLPKRKNGLYQVVSSGYPTADMRQKTPKTLIKGGLVDPEHWTKVSTGFFGRNSVTRYHVSMELMQAITSCEDPDELVAALTAIKKFNQQ